MDRALLADRPESCCFAGEAGDRQDAAREAGRRGAGAGLRRAARRGDRARRRGAARLRPADTRRCAPRGVPALRAAPGSRGSCTSCCWSRLAARRRRCCSPSRTCTGRTARRASSSPSSPATCAPSGSPCSPPTARRRAVAGSCGGSSPSWSGGATVTRIELEPLTADEVGAAARGDRRRARAGVARAATARARGRQPVLRRGAVRGPRGGCRERRRGRAAARVAAARPAAGAPRARRRRGRAASTTRCSSALDGEPGRAARGARGRAPGARARRPRHRVPPRPDRRGRLRRLLPAERASCTARSPARARRAPAAQLAHQWYRAGAARARRWPRRSRPGSRPRACTRSPRRGAHLERALELWDAGGGRCRSTRSSCCRAPPRPRASRGDRERAVARCREAIDAGRDEPVRAALLYERLGEYHFWDDEAALECYEQRAGAARRPGRSARGCSPPRATR